MTNATVVLKNVGAVTLSAVAAATTVVSIVLRFADIMVAHTKFVLITVSARDRGTYSGFPEAQGSSMLGRNKVWEFYWRAWPAGGPVGGCTYKSARSAPKQEGK